MKSILIAAGIVGAAAAGTILYLKKRNNAGTDEVKGAAKNAYKKMNAGIGKAERAGQHSMG
ncbi:MAG: hypothetical protein ACJ748_06165 [Flavisolibacter sp.]